jgi:hypothetical protein
LLLPLLDDLVTLLLLSVVDACVLAALTLLVALGSDLFDTEGPFESSANDTCLIFGDTVFLEIF